jgi:uncharacterized protein YjiS (DUF1127 family)
MTMSTHTDIRPSSSAVPTIWGRFAVLFGRLANRCIARVIARWERQAARVALRRLDDRELKDIGVHRHRIDGALTEIAHERTRLQQHRQSG